MLPLVPPAGSARCSALSSTGSSGASSPASTVLWRCATPDRPSRRTPLPSHDGTIPCACVRVSRQPDAGWGPGVFGFGNPEPTYCRDGDGRASQVPGEPSCPYALFSDPGRSARTRPLQCGSTAPALSTEKATHDKYLSGLNGTALGLAVYASQPPLPEHHARRASGRWPGSPGWDWLPTGFR